MTKDLWRTRPVFPAVQARTGESRTVVRRAASGRPPVPSNEFAQVARGGVRARRESPSRRPSFRPRHPAEPAVASSPSCTRRPDRGPTSGRRRARGGRLATALGLALLAALAAPPVLAQTEHEVPANWSLKPDDVAAGGKFRLLFVSTTTRDATSSDIADYNTHVQSAAAAGHTAIQSYSADFTAIASTGAVNARTNTLTRSTDADTPIYWVSETTSRSAVATGYADFYDGTWGDSLNQEARTETGATHTFSSGQASEAFTGTDLDGTDGNLPGSIISSVWYLHSDGDGTLDTANGTASIARRSLALSPIFKVATTTTTLVSNFSDIDSNASVRVGEAGASIHRAGTQFTTGANANGYVLKSLTFSISAVPASGVAPKVSIYTSVSDEPGAELYTFSDPSVSFGDKTVTAQANATLAASTSYFVVFEDSDTADGSWTANLTNTSTVYDTDSLTDWSLSGRIHSSDGGTTWGSPLTSRVAVKLTGEVVGTSTTPAPTEVTIWSATLTLGEPDADDGPEGYCTSSCSDTLISQYVNFGMLNPAEFSVPGGTTYTVHGLWYGGFDGASTLFFDPSAGGIAFDLDPGLELRLGDNSHAFADAFDATGTFGPLYGWVLASDHSERPWPEPDTTDAIADTVEVALVDTTLAPEHEVPADWSLKPDGVGAGDKFRLLFVSSTSRNASPDDIADYNSHVQAAAAAGHADIQAYSGDFTVIGSTSAVNARGNTETTGLSSDTPIYWLSETTTRAAVAAGYADFYDGTWGDTSGTLESGVSTTLTSTNAAFSGTKADSGYTATSPTQDALGETGPITTWHLVGTTVTEGTAAATATRRFFALSPIFAVASGGATGAPGIDGTPQVDETLTATAGDMADPDGLPTTAFPTGYTFQWVLDDAGTETDISGATTQTYVPVSTDAGKTIKVEVTFEDGGGTDETLASVATQPVAGAKTTCPTYNEWCAEMESGYGIAATTNTTLEDFGYDPATSFGALGEDEDDDDFSHAGTDYTVTELYRARAITNGAVTSHTLRLVTGTTLPDGTVLTLNGTELTVGADSETMTVGRESWDLEALGIDFDWVTDTKVTTSLNFPPKLTTATVDGTSLVLTYHENLDTNSVPALAQFTVKKTPTGGTEGDVDLSGSPTISDAKVTLTLDEAVVATDDAVKVSYAVPVSNTLRDESGLDASAETDYPVTNNTGMTPVNNAPEFTDGESTSRGVNENESSGTSFGRFVAAADADSDALTYSVEGTDAASFGIGPSNGWLRTKEVFDHETKSSYTITVKVVDTSNASDTITVTVNITDRNEQPFTPAAPTVNAKAGATDQLEVAWTKPGLNGGPDITGYKLQYRTGSEPWSEATPMGTGLTHTLGSLAEDTAYEVQVRALNGETPSNWSTSGRGTTGVTNAAPVFDEGASTSRSVAENTTSGTDFGSAVSATDADTNDTLTYSLEGTDAASFGIDSGTGQLKTSAALDYETKSSYSVRVKVVDGNSGSDTIAVTINVADRNEQPARPAAPTVNGKAGTTDELEVSWSKPGLNGGPDITGYLLRFRVPGETWSERTPSGINRTYTIGGLSADTAYEVQVKAQNGETDSAWSQSGTATTGRSQPAVSFSASSYTATEGGAGATVTVRLSRTPDAQVTIPITRTNRSGASNADYSGVPASLTFGTSATSRSFTVTATDDDEEDPGERLDLAFGTLPAGVVAGQPSGATVHFVDNDHVAARVTFGARAQAVIEGASAAPVTLRLEPGGLGRAVTVRLTTEHIGGATGADYTGIPSSVTFGIGEDERMFRVVPVDDDEDDDCEAVRIGIDRGTLPEDVRVGRYPTKLIPLQDDEGIPTWRVSFEAGAYTAREGGAATVAVVTSEPWGPCGNEALTIPLMVAAHGGGATAADYDVPESVTIRAGATRATFTVRAVDDAADDDGESVTLGMAWQRFPDRLEAGGHGPTETTVALADDDGATEVAVSFGAGAYTAVEGGAAAGVEVRLDRAPGREVRVPLTTTRRGASSGDFSGVPASVVFGAAQTVRSFQVTATDDNDNDDGESIEIGFGTLPQAVSAGSPAIATVQLEDDDGPVARYTVRFDASSSLVRTVNEGGCSWTGARVDPAPDPALVLPLVATPRRGATAADYSDLPADLVFEAGETRSGFNVCAVDDTEEDPGEGLVVRFGTLPAGVEAADGKDAATFDIVDNDGPPGVSIGDASVRERLGSTYSRLIFTLELDRRGDVETSVRWRTVDGTATAGEDYEAASGTATFPPRKDWVQIAVQTIYDEVAEGNETMTVVLSGPRGLRIADGTGTGTILDSRASSGVADAFVSGARLTLRYAEPLDGGSTPGPKDWVVRAESAAGGRTVPVVGVAVSGPEAVLELAAPATPAEAVSVSYLPWPMHPLRHGDGVEAAPLAELAVRNDTPLRLPEREREGNGGLEPEAVALTGDLDKDAPDGDLSLVLRAAAPERFDLAAHLRWLLQDRPASSVVRLDLPARGLADVSALAGLTGLEVLDLSGNAVADAWPLAELLSVKRLDLSDNRIADLSALAGLTRLEVLLLDGNAVADLGPLSQLPRLAHLGLSRNGIGDVTLLADLPALERLDLSGNAVSEVAPLGDLGRLVWLDLTGNPLADAVPLGRLTRLRWLWLAPDADGVWALARGASRADAPLRIEPPAAAAAARQ